MTRDISSLDALVRERVGIDAARQHRGYRQHLIDLAMTRAGVRDEVAFVALLERDAHAFDDLISDLTIPESYFFRDAATFELLRREVLPALTRARGRGRDHMLEVWSAGCAGGEEAYSLAILLEQEGLEQRARVIGTDVSSRALARASEGVYARWSLRASSSRDMARYFHEEGNKFRLTQRIRERVRFQKHNLNAATYPRPPAGFDLVLCRNVLIYFDGRATATTGQRLAQTLAENGYLLLGPSDPPLSIEEWCEAIPTGCGTLYRRHGARPDGSRPKPAHRDTVLRAHTTPSSAAAVAAPVARSRTLSARSARSSEPTPVAPATRLAADLAALRLLIGEHGPRAAEAGCRDLLAEHPMAAELHFMHAALLVDLGRHPAAEAAVRRALYLDRGLVPALFLAATLCERRGERTGAQRGYAAVIAQCRVHPDDALVTLGEGVTYGALAAVATQRDAALRSAGDDAWRARASTPRQRPMEEDNDAR